MVCILHSKEPLVLFDNMDSYFLSTPPDCSLFSQDNHEIQIHKELLYQTKFMREMISGIGIDSNIDVICPSVSKEELEIIVQFLYNGKLVHPDETIVSKASKNLEELFGFPSLQGEVWTETIEIERDMDINEVIFSLSTYIYFFDSWGVALCVQMDFMRTF